MLHLCFCSGWVRCTSVAAFSTSQEEVRSLIGPRIGEVLGFPYLWGGRSALSLALLEKGVQLTGLDCSGLVSMFYLVNGWILPRDASKQAMVVENVTTAQMLVGDVFFFGIPNSTTSPVGHVMMLYSLTPEPLIVESATNSTRILTVEEKYGAKLQDLQWSLPLKVFPFSKDVPNNVFLLISLAFSFIFYILGRDGSWVHSHLGRAALTVVSPRSCRLFQVV